MKKVLIANRGENGSEATVSPHCSACAAGDGDIARPTICTPKDAQ
jgi:hypothetical protein